MQSDSKTVSELQETAGSRLAESGVEASLTEEILGKHLRWLRGWLGAHLRGGDAQEVDDLCQEVLLHALRGLGELRRRDRLAPWLYRIALNVLRDFRRQKARRREVEEDLERLEDPREFTADIACQDEVADLLRRIGALPRRYREPMLLRHVDDLSYAEIARILGVRRETVQVRMFRAREMLRRSLERRTPRTGETRESGTDRCHDGKPPSPAKKH